MRRDRACGGILEGDRLVRPDAELVDREAVQVGLGLGRGYAFAAGHEIEAIEQAQPREMPCAVFAAGVGCDGEAATGFAGGIAQGHDAGLHRLAVGAFAVAPLHLLVKGLAVDMRPEGSPLVESDFHMPYPAGERGAVEWLAMCGMHIVVRIEKRSLGIENNAVKIENERSNHGGNSREEPA